jgi:hypothetical protein
MYIFNFIITEANTVIRPIIRSGQSLPVLINATSKLIEKFRRFSIYLVKKQKISSNKITSKNNELIRIYTEAIVKKMAKKIEKYRKRKKKKEKTTLL